MSDRDQVVERSIYPTVFGVLLVGALMAGLGVFVGMKYMNPAPPAGPAAAAPSGADEKAAADGSKAAAADEVGTLSADLKKLEAAHAELESRVDQMQAQLGAAAKPSPDVDLKSLESRVTELAKSNEAIAGMTDKLDTVMDRLATLEKTNESLASELANLREQAVAAPRPAADTARPAEREGDVEDPALARGIELFKQGKYSEALGVFRKYTESNPNDARGWYYAALANGFATKQWQGETERLVTRGVEREKAGTPDPAAINAAFSDLAPAARTWLAAYRKRAASR